MIPLLVISALTPFLLGEAVLSLAVRSGYHDLNRTLRICFAGCAGYGFASVLYFLWRTADGPADLKYAFFETSFIIILLAGSFRQRAASGSGRNRPVIRSSPLWIRLTILSGLVMLGAAFVLYSTSFSHGTVDSWAIWNLHAKFIHRGGEQWWKAYAQLDELTHPDYPLLVPSIVARFWAFSGETTAAPAILGGFSCAALCALPFGLLRTLRIYPQTWIAVLLTVPPIILLQASSQTADIPLAVFYLGSAGVLVLSDSPGRFFLSGLMAGFAAWTKNEGLLFLAVSGVVLVMRNMSAGGARAVLGPARNFLAGAAVPLMAIVLFKLLVPATNDIVGAATSGANLIRKISDPDRYAKIGTAFLDEIIAFGHGAPWIVAAIWIAGLRHARPERTVWPGFLIIVLTLSGYFSAYLVTPRDLDWHLATSLVRLLCHVWPLVAVMTLSATPPADSGVRSGPDMLYG